MPEEDTVTAGPVPIRRRSRLALIQETAETTSQKAETLNHTPNMAATMMSDHSCPSWK